MLILYALWIVVIGSGFWLGIGSILTMRADGIDAALMAMAILYNGCALYGIPKLFKLITAPPAHGR